MVSANKIQVRTIALLASAVAALVLAVAPILHAQTTDSDINLRRLADAVKAINESQLAPAEELLNAILKTAPNDPDALNLLGVVRAKQSRATEAERLFRRALARSPSHLSAHINLGELLLNNNRPAEAMPILLRAHKLAPDRPEINLNLARLHADKDSYQQAYDYLRLVTRENFSDDYFLLMARSLMALKRTNDLPALIAEFRELSPEAPETHAAFAMQLAKGGFNDDALRILNAAYQKSPTSFPVLYGLGLITAGLKQFDKADQYFSAALAIKPDDVATLRALARVARSNGNLEKSLSHLVEARRLAPNSPAVLYDFGVTAFQMDLFLDALPVFERLHRDHPREPAYLYGLAAVRWRKGETVETARLMNSYITLQPRDASGYYLLGAALLRQDLFVEAQAALKRSFSLKADPETEFLLGVASEKLGDRAAAIETFRRVIKARPDHAAALSALGAAYREAGNFTEAQAALERAVELDQNDLRATYQLGLVYSKLGNSEAAKRMFARADDLRGQQRNLESVVLKLIDSPQN